MSKPKSRAADAKRLRERRAAEGLVQMHTWMTPDERRCLTQVLERKRRMNK